MNSPNSSGIERPVIRVDQPLGTFYAFSLNADVLSKLTYSQPAEVTARMERESSEHGGGYSILGTQRKESKKRLDEIAEFIQTSEATFPNAIILAANYDREGRYIDEETKRWRVQREANDQWRLHIPTLEGPSASIIDGQHRLHAFQRLEDNAPNREMELLCVVFLELPTPFHAFVFATINFNQKKVDRSLAYELFGFDVDERPPEFWAPETLAVYLARLLNTDQLSPLYRCVYPAADSHQLFRNDGSSVDPDVKISMATVVDGILRLISKKPMEDRYAIRKKENHLKGRSALPKINSLPLRDNYLAGNDRAVYEVVSNFFSAVRDTVWRGAGEGSYLYKTVGIQALFDVLQVMLTTYPLNSTNYSRDKLALRLSPAMNLDPKAEKYQASGIGRSVIRQELLAVLGLALR